MKVSTYLRLGILAGLAALALQLGGCASMTSGLECAAESINPTVMAALDSFETAAVSIKLSNRVLLKTPLSEKSIWPNDLYGAPSGEAMLKGALSLFASSQGITLVTEIDPATGFPKPTSALYIFLKDREKLLNKHTNRRQIAYFKSNPYALFLEEPVDPIDGDAEPLYVYRNPLMAYGVVTNNKEEMARLEQQIDLKAKGFGECDAWVHKSSEGDVKPAVCLDPALKDESFKVMEVKQKKEEFADMEKNYGKLANKVYNASVAGADFTTAALVKIGCAVVNGIRAMPNIKKEFRGVRGVYNVVTLVPRIRGVFNALGIYKDNLGMQFTAYSTMYKQIKGVYTIKDEDPAHQQKTKEALLRIEMAQATLQELMPKIDLYLAGLNVEFTEQDQARMAAINGLFPADPVFEQALVAALEL